MIKGGDTMRDELVYDGWLKVAQRKIGNKPYEILKDYDAVAAIITNGRKELLLVKQFRPALMEETCEIPAGTLDQKEESIEDCLIREIKEETGLIVKPEELVHFLTYKPNVGFSNSQMHMYAVKIQGDPAKSWKIRGDDVSEVLWMGFDALEESIRLGRQQDIKTILAYLYMKGLYSS